jgi:hypothetical protein
VLLRNPSTFGMMGFAGLGARAVMSLLVANPIVNRAIR